MHKRTHARSRLAKETTELFSSAGYALSARVMLPRGARAFTTYNNDQGMNARTPGFRTAHGSHMRAHINADYAFKLCRTCVCATARGGRDESAHTRLLTRACTSEVDGLVFVLLFSGVVAVFCHFLGPNSAGCE